MAGSSLYVDPGCDLVSGQGLGCDLSDSGMDLGSDLDSVLDLDLDRVLGLDQRLDPDLGCSSNNSFLKPDLVSGGSLVVPSDFLPL